MFDVWSLHRLKGPLIRVFVSWPNCPARLIVPENTKASLRVFGAEELELYLGPQVDQT